MSRYHSTLPENTLELRKKFLVFLDQDELFLNLQLDNKRPNNREVKPVNKIKRQNWLLCLRPVLACNK